MFKFLRKVDVLSPLFFVRDEIMDKYGFFEKKRKLKQKLLFRRLLREDKKQKRKIDKLIYQLPDNLLERDIHDEDIIVSMTSYARRVSDALPYALYSLLKQTIIPKKIVVYLDKENWSDEQLPDILRKMQNVGVDFRYYEDIRSYKKLIPALLDFPNNPIITMDDDFYYNIHYFEWMLNAYEQSDKKTVLGQWGCIPEKKNGKYIPYSQWKDCKMGTKESPISFFGCCCCYPPHIFDDEILRKELFMRLCPTADDIWFWVMEERLHIKRAYIEPWGYGFNTPVNRIEEYDWTQRGTLMYQNVVEGKNDTQLKMLLDYYNLED